MMILILFTLGLIFIGMPLAVAIASILNLPTRRHFSRRPARPALSIPDSAGICACQAPGLL